MISKVSIRDFKCLQAVEIELERFTVFVGPNASGKSSILQAMEFLTRSFREQEGSVEGELSQAARKGSSGNVEVGAESAGKAYRYRARSPSSPGNPQFFGQFGGMPGQPWSGEGRGVAPNLTAADWKPWTASESNLSPLRPTTTTTTTARPTTTTTTTPAPSWTPSEPDQSPLPLSVLLRLEASNLVAPNPASPDPAVMAPNGVGLHSALANMALNDPDSWQELQANLRRIIPSVRRLRHTKASMHQAAALLFDAVGADSIPASQMSEGTLLVLGLLAVLHGPSRPGLILLDDLDRGLHPRAQKELISLLRGLLETNPDLQMIATTHSPYLLDCMETNEVRMTMLADDGWTVCAALASHPEFQKWKDEMAPGEMWSLFGEKWLVEEGVTA